MLPQLSPLSASTGSVQVPPPPYFKPLQGKPYGVDLINPREHKDDELTAAQASGLRYERKVHEHLARVWGIQYKPSPSFSFYDNTGKRFIVPDGLRLGPSLIVVVEVKFQHSVEAWYQLRQLYQPVLEEYYQLPVAVVEICRTYDPATAFPEPVELLDDLNTNIHPRFGVYRWR